ncbi:uncharacterized protein M6B38_144965 [Iris pallida]|uniref:Uncharacterized protein n=1 Tax=Iris pallida TaxID=29817 RepID=A0AAX6FAF0_IRIPA|nr:uncharacterized protein M6B38_144965 [Iris pallida]
MEIDNLSKTDTDGPNTYIDNLMLQMESLNLAHVREDVIKNPIAPSAASGSGDPDALLIRACSHEMPTVSTDVSEECSSVDHSRFVIQEIIKRRALVSCISSVEMGVNTVSQIVTKSSLLVSEKNPSEAQTTHAISPKKERFFTELNLWNRWRSRCLTYLLDKRTIRLLSGANLIFRAPKVQWIRILEPLKNSVDVHGENLLEIVEIFLLGFISRRWNLLIEHFSSHSFNFTPLSKQYSDLCHLLQENSEYVHFKREPMSSKEKEIFEYLVQLLRTQPRILWQVPPVLAAAAFPPWSILFRMYMDDIEKQFNEASPLNRCRGCRQHGKDHEDCEVSERIRCLHVFHVQGLHLMVGDCSN